MVRRYGAAVAAVALCAIALSSAAADVAPGLWETTAQVDMPEAAGGNIAPITQTRCFRNTDVQDPQKLMPADAGCELSMSRMEGNRLTWGMKCASGMAGSGEVTFTPTSYEGVFRATGGGTQMTMNYSGKRIGDCQ